MRIRRVTAHAFGPLAGQTLQLGEGMTVVVGPNESGKSTWHAALFAALCGRRRGAGRPGADEARFIELHKPWDGEQWEVSAEITLDDGRRIELRQDLAGKVDCQARDLDLGVDVSNEIMWKGSPDASRWLGLDRTTFPATAAVRQSQLLKVLEEASALQTYLQQAAATAGTDETAAAALAHLKEFTAEQVGRNQSNSVRPWRRAVEAVTAAQAALDRARTEHLEYLARAEQVETLALAAAVAGDRLREHEAAATRDRAAALAARLGQARALHAECAGHAPVALTDDADLAAQVTAALTRWISRPADPGHQATLVPDPPAVSQDEATTSTQHVGTVEVDTLREQLAGLPPAPDGDTDPAEDVEQAAAGLARARSELDAHHGARPARPQLTLPEQLAGALAVDEAAGALTGPLITASDAELLELASALEARPAPPDAGLLAQAEAAQATAGAPAPASKARIPLLALGGLLAAAGVVLLGAGSLPAGAALVVLGVLVAVGALATGRGTRGPSPDAVAHAARLRGEVERRQQEAARVSQARDRAAARCAELALPAEATLVRAAAATRAQLGGQLAGYAQSEHTWAATLARLVDALRDHASAAAEVLAAHGETGAHPTSLAGSAPAARTNPAALGEREEQARREAEQVALLVREYHRRCRERAAQAAAAARRTDLTERIAAAEQALEAAARERAARADAAQAAHQQQLAAARRAAGTRGDIAAAALVVLEAHAAVAGTPAGLAAGDPGALEPAAFEALVERAGLAATELTGWQAERVERLAAHDQAGAVWTRLQAALAGQTLDELAEASTQADADAATAAAGVDEAALAAIDPGTAEASLPALRAAARTAEAQAAEAAGQLRQFQGALTPVADAEEALEVANGELARVEELRETLELTTRFLQDAQERVHRSIAPVLARTVTKALPAVTGGRYIEATVTPTTLQVQVCGPDRRWRHADHLSHGTAEQVFLLLRVALAEHLTAGHDRCPLILDDVTVHADSARTRAMLGLLLEIAEDRQVVLFTQEDQVAEWARDNLSDPRHRVISLLDAGISHAEAAAQVPTQGGGIVVEGLPAGPPSA